MRIDEPDSLSPHDGRGAVRRLVIGTATVEVRFRNRETDPDEVVVVLRRAAEMAQADKMK